MRKIDMKSIAMVLSAVLICSLIAFAELQNNDSNTVNLPEHAISNTADSNEINNLIDALKGKNFHVRRRAKESLIEIGGPAVPSLMTLLRDKDSDISWTAADLLRQIGKPAAEPLITALKDNDPNVRWQAARALVKIKDARAVEPLIAALKGKNKNVREFAAEALGEIGDSRAVQPLVIVLKDKDWWLRKTGAKALGQIGDANAVNSLAIALKDKFWQVREEAAVALGKIGDKRAVEPLIAALKEKDSGVSLKVVVALGKIKDDRAVEPLIATLISTSKNPGYAFTYGAAAYALGQLGDTRAVEPLVAILNYENAEFDPQDRIIAAQSLATIGKSGIEPLVVALNNSDPNIRLGAGVALARIDDSRGIDCLISSLKDKSQNIRVLTALYLGKIGDKRAVGPLIGALKDEDLYVRWEAAKALGRIKDARAVEPLINALKNDPDIRESVICALGGIGDMRAVEPLIIALKYEQQLDRATAADVLGDMKAQKAIPELVAALRDWSIDVRVAEALDKLGWKPQTVEDKVHYCVAIEDKTTLTAMWEQTKEVLLKDIQSNEVYVMENAIFAFAGLGNKAIIPDLINVLHTNGSKTMAEAYLLCEEKTLASAAQSWAQEHGCTLTPSEDTQFISTWGSWNSIAAPANHIIK